MHGHNAEGRSHDHSFGQVARRRQERRVFGVCLLTAGAVLVEIAAGWATGSMALLGDGVHMGTHAFALGLAYLAFALARRHAANRGFSFGTGKIGELAGFSSALQPGEHRRALPADALLHHPIIDVQRCR